MRRRFSEHDIEFLRGCTETVVREVLGVTDPSRAMRCPNPDHDDSDPSAHFYVKDGLVHCFGCDGTWDVFGLVGMVYGIAGFREQVEKVAEIVGYRLSDAEEPPRPRPRRKPRPPYEAPREAGAQDVFEQCGLAFGDLYAPGNEVGRRYLRYRGLDDVDAARWALGYVRDPRSIMRQFSVSELEALGFITIPFFTDSTFSRVNYVMVRTISRGKVRNKEWRPKGVASPLWNEWMLRESLPAVYVTEGLIDAMALSKFTGKPTMALGGVANAKRFAQVLYHTPPEKRPAKVVVCMDCDEEGRKASERMCGDLARIGVAHAVLPDYPGGAKDADELLMATKGVKWDFEEYEGSIPGFGPLYRTRWRDDG